MLSLLLKLHCLCMQASAMGSFTEGWYYSEWWLNRRYTIDYLYDLIGRPETINLDEVVTLTTNLSELEASMVSTFKELLTLIDAEARASFKTDLLRFHYLCDALERATSYYNEINNKLTVRDFNPNEQEPIS